MQEFYQSKETQKGFGRAARVFLYAVLLVAVFVFVLPFTQQLSQRSEQRTVRSIGTSLPPPPPPPPEPPPPEEEKVEQPKPKLKSQPKPMSLSQLQLAMNPGMGDAFGGAFGMGSFDVETNAMDDINMFSLAELDEKPRPLRSPNWTWPRHSMGRVKQNIFGKALIVVTERGRVEFQRFISLSDPIVESEMIDHIEKFVMSAPTRNGKPVRTRFVFPLTLEKP